METACALPAAENPAALLAAFVADAASAGRDKLTVVASPPLASFGLWVEQLVAESLGKEGRGVVPVVELSDDRPQGYGSDRAVVVVRLEGDQRLAEWAAKLAETTPVIELVLRDGYDVAAEWVRWEHAVALLGPLLGVNPFGQPNVQAAKDATNAALAGELTLDRAAGRDARRRRDHLRRDAARRPDTPSATSRPRSGTRSRRCARTTTSRSSPTCRTTSALLAPLTSAVPRVSAELSSAVTFELGPRYLHSTGQLHKGGPNTGVFLLVTTRDHADAPVPGRPWSLRTLHRAQAEGDLSTLVTAGRRVLWVDLPDATCESVTAFARALMDAAGVAWEA